MKQTRGQALVDLLSSCTEQGSQTQRTFAGSGIFSAGCFGLGNGGSKSNFTKQLEMEYWVLEW